MPSLSIPSSARLLILVVMLICAAGFTATLKPMPQPLAYHQFADARQMFGIPRALDVLSNLPFVLAGFAGLYLCWSATRRSLETDVRAAYATMFAGLLLTGFGSAYYHLAPDNQRLVWDRLPMTLVMAGFLSVLVMNRTRLRVVWILPLLASVGLCSALTWWWSEAHGHGDLRWYALFQALAILTGVLLLGMFNAKRSEGTGTLVIAIAANIAAKVFELLDRPIYHLGGIISGHTLKHLSAGLGFVPLLIWLAAQRKNAMNLPEITPRQQQQAKVMPHEKH